ncbi:MAG: D-alanine--D-alanine ligase [Deltaproteobacteria bacterium]|nr:D-alanine--D-alanine ligase [Deltaproteobacteria bacterium]
MAPFVAVVYNDDFLAEDSLQSLAQKANAEVAEVARHVAMVLDARGHRTTVVSVTSDVSDLERRLRGLDPDLVFNLVESLGGSSAREPEIPELLAAMGIPFTGCGVLGIRNAHDKPLAKRLLVEAQVPVPVGFVVRPGEDLRMAPGVRFPLFVKPAEEDGSIGIDQTSVVFDLAQLSARVDALTSAISGPALVEEYLPGAEINVAVLDTIEGRKTFPTTIDFSSLPSGLLPVVTYAAKWIEGSPEYTIRSVRAETLLPEDVVAKAERVARRAFDVLGLKGLGRVDLRLDSLGDPRVIDVNPNPDLHPEAGFTVAAGYRGLSYEQLIGGLVSFADKDRKR